MLSMIHLFLSGLRTKCVILFIFCIGVPSCFLNRFGITVSETTADLLYVYLEAAQYRIGLGTSLVCFAMDSTYPLFSSAFLPLLTPPLDASAT